MAASPTLLVGDAAVQCEFDPHEERERRNVCDKSLTEIPRRPQCPANTDALSYQRRIAYYELFSLAKDCNVIQPESLVVAPFTHINLAFVNFGDDYQLIDADGDAIDRMSLLKFDNAGLRINIAVGGWAFSDPPTQYLWSESTS